MFVPRLMGSSIRFRQNREALLVAANSCFKWLICGSVLVRAFVDEPDVGRLVREIPSTSRGMLFRAESGIPYLRPFRRLFEFRGSRNVGETTSIVDNEDLKLLPNINVGVTIVAAAARKCARRSARGRSNG